MAHPQEHRINNNLDSQVKRTLQRAIEYEQMKKHLAKMLDQIEAEEGWTASTEFCEEYIQACRSLNRDCYEAEVWLDAEYSK